MERVETAAPKYDRPRMTTGAPYETEALAGFGAPGAIRVTVGTLEQTDLFAQAFRRVAAATSAA